MRTITREKHVPQWSFGPRHTENNQYTLPTYTPECSFGRSDQENVVDDDLLSRTLASILRHQTDFLEKEGSHMPGFMSERRLLIAVHRHKKLRNCTIEDLVRVVDESVHRDKDKARFEVAVRCENSGGLTGTD